MTVETKRTQCWLEELSVQYFASAKKHCRSLYKAGIFKCSFWPLHVVWTHCHERCKVNGIYTKQSRERKREKDKLESACPAEKLLQIHKELKVKNVLRSSEKNKKGSSASNRRWTVKQRRRNKLWSPTNLK